MNQADPEGCSIFPPQVRNDIRTAAKQKLIEDYRRGEIDEIALAATIYDLGLADA